MNWGTIKMAQMVGLGFIALSELAMYAMGDTTLYRSSMIAILAIGWAIAIDETRRQGVSSR